MKGNQKIIALLNAAIEHELAVIDQYVIHASIQGNWKLDKLAKETMDRAKQEMAHLDDFMDRVVFLSGIPSSMKMQEFKIGNDPLAQIELELGMELAVIKQYNEAIAVCDNEGDYGSWELFNSVLKDEEAHALYLESQVEQARLMTTANWISTLS